MRRRPGLAKNWFLSVLTSIRLSSAACVGATTLLLAPTLASCDDHNVDTMEGLKKAFEDGKNIQKAVERLKDLDSNQLAEIAPALQKRFIEGAPGFDQQIFQRLSQLKSPDYLDAYIHALKSKDDEMIRPASAIIGDLGLTKGEEGLAYAFDNTAKPEIQQILLEDGLKAKSKMMADRAAKLLDRDNIDNLPLTLLSAVCKTLEQNPDPNAIDKLIPLAFRKDSSGKSINSECTKTIQTFGSAAVDGIKRLAANKNTQVAQMVKRKDYKLSREDVLIGITDMLLGLGDPRAADILLDLITDPAEIREPAALLNNPTAEEADRQKWSQSVMVGHQLLLQVLNRIGVKGVEGRARDAVMGFFRWGAAQRHKFTMVAGAVLFEPVMRGEAVRLLAEQDLLDEALVAEIIAALRDPAWEANEDKRFKRTLLTGNILVYLTIAGVKGVPIQKLYEEFAYTIQRDIAFVSLAKLTDVDACLEILKERAEKPPEMGPDGKPKTFTLNSPADCYEQQVKDLNTLMESEAIPAAEPATPAEAKLVAKDLTRNAYGTLRAASLAILEKCKGAADRETCYKTEFVAYDALIKTLFPKPAQGIYAEMQIPGMQIKQAKVALDATTRCDAESDKFACYKLTMETNKDEPESGAFIRSVYALGKSSKPEYFPAVLNIYKQQYDTAQYIGNSLYRLATPEHLPLIETLIKKPDTQIKDQKMRIQHNQLMQTQMGFLKLFVQNRAASGK